MIRIAEPQDLNFIRQCLQNVGVDRQDLKNFVNVPEDVVKEYLNPANRDNKLVVILSVDGEDVGFAAFDVIITPYNLPYKMTNLAGLFINSEHRGKGLMDFVHEAFDSWSKHVGSQYQIIGVTNDADVTSWGYKVFEVMHIKEVN